MTCRRPESGERRGRGCADAQGVRPVAEVLHELIRERGLSMAEVVNTVALQRSGPTRSTTYRVLSGETRDPPTATLAALCRAMDVRPQEVFERAGLWTVSGDRGQATGDRKAGGSAQQAQLRAVWTAVACLPDAERGRITQVVRALVDAAHAHREQLSAQQR